MDKLALTECGARLPISDISLDISNFCNQPPEDIWRNRDRGYPPTTRFTIAARVRTGLRPALACAGQDGRSRRRRENPLCEFLVQQVETPAFATDQL